MTADVVEAIRAMACTSEAERIGLFNAATTALRELLSDVSADPVLGVQLIDAGHIRPNDYNPNKVAPVELDLLEDSIRADGVTMPVVVVRDGEDAVVVDGFHRQDVIINRLGRRWIPCSVIECAPGDRMASTVRHNRARGKHQVDLMGELVRRLLLEGWADEQIAEHLGMSREEILRLRQLTGAARALAAPEYTRANCTKDAP